MKDTLSKTGFVTAAFFASLFCTGLFFEYVSCIASAVFVAWLFFNHIKKKRTVIYWNPTTLTVGLIVLGYAVTSIWAVDSGIAFIGFIKYLPLLLFALMMMQTDERAITMWLMPYIVSFMVILSAILAQVPSLSDGFLVAGRLSGFFQYPNTFAILILVSEILVLTKKRLRYYDYIAIGVLVAGLLYTGSRTVFVIALVANTAAIILTRSKKFMLYAFISAVGAIAVASALLAATGNTAVLERFARLSFYESTFAGRLLYYYDALPIILKHPFGLGYMGYSLLQPTFQTGVYSVSYIHNDFLQLMLDIGWIPALLFIFIVAKKIFGKGSSKRERLILSCLAVHGLFDFDLQFVAIFFIYLFFLDIKQGKPIVIEGKLPVYATVAAVLACVVLYTGTSLVLYRLERLEESYTLYPCNPNTEAAIVSSSSDIEFMNEMADGMLSRNDKSLLAHSVKARYYYSIGDFEQVIKYKHKIFELAPLQYAEYEEYARMLINGINLYEQAGDTESLEICKSELRAIPAMLEKLPERLSPLGKIIKDQPTTALPDVLTEYISNLE